MAAETSTTLKAAAHTIIVQPSIADNDEHQRASGLFVAGDDGRPRLYRGVVLDIGAHIDEPNGEVGSVIHYSSYAVIGVGELTLHVVTTQHILAFE